MFYQSLLHISQLARSSFIHDILFVTIILCNYYCLFCYCLFSKVPRTKRKTRAINLLRQVELYNKRENFPAELSGGDKQRIGIARALANDPRVIIADEPTGDLDSENAEAIIQLLFKVNSQGKTIIMVTHDESLLSDSMRILHLVDGKIALT